MGVIKGRDEQSFNVASTVSWTFENRIVCFFVDTSASSET